VVYKITNNLTSDIYIGYTSKSIDKRFRRHIFNSKKGQTYLYRSMRKYGVENFEVCVLKEDGTFEDEVYFIEKLKPTLNMTFGGEGGDTSSSPNFKKSMENYHMKKNREDYATNGFKGKKHKESSIKIISEKNSCSVSCEGKVFSSIKEAEEYYRSMGTPKSVRKRIDSSKHTDWFRVGIKRKYPKN
jgi:group I intron endonuclease